MNIFGIGLPELAVIAAIGLLVFGPKRLPELGKTLGRTLRGFQSASQEFEQEFRSAIGADAGAVAPAAPAAAEAPAQLSASDQPPTPVTAEVVLDAAAPPAADAAAIDEAAGLEPGSGPV